MPLLPLKTAQRITVTLKEKPKRVVLGLNEPILTAKQIEAAQLPIDTLLGSPYPELLVDGGQWCTACEYLLHFVQETMASPKNEVNINSLRFSNDFKLFLSQLSLRQTSKILFGTLA